MRQHYTPEPKRSPFWADAAMACAIGIVLALVLFVYL
jgi:hypothetical protein